jgi:hypothetical protein
LIIEEAKNQSKNDISEVSLKPEPKSPKAKIQKKPIVADSPVSDNKNQAVVVDIEEHKLQL